MGPALKALGQESNRGKASILKQLYVKIFEFPGADLQLWLLESAKRRNSLESTRTSLRHAEAVRVVSSSALQSRFAT